MKGPWPPKGYIGKNATKRLAPFVKLASGVIPQDPIRLEYRQGVALGDEYKHWFRAKFFQQYRLFFRYRRKSRIIIYTWLNDENTKRAYESASDAYRTSRRVLKNGNPPDDWSQLPTQEPRQKHTTNGRALRIQLDRYSAWWRLVDVSGQGDSRVERLRFSCESYHRKEFSVLG